MTLRKYPSRISEFGILLFASTIAISHVPAQFGIGFALLGWILDGLINKNWMTKWHPIFVPLLLYLTWNVVASALSPRPAHSLLALVDNEWPAILMLTMFWTITETRMLSRIVYALFVSSSVAMVYAIWQGFYGVELYRKLPLDPMGAYFRSVGFFGFYLTFAAFAMAIFFLSTAYLLEGRREKKWKWSILPILSLGAVILTFARSIWLSFIGVIPFLGILRGKKKDWIAVSAFLGLFVAGILWIPALRQRAESTFDLRSNETRINLWQTSLRISSDFRVFGIGEDNFDYYFEKYKVPGFYDTTAHPHSDYLNVLINSGVPGLLFFLALWGITIRTGVLTWREARDKNVRALSLGGVLSIAGLMIGALFQDYYGSFINCLEWWFVTGLIFAAQRVQSEIVSGGSAVGAL
jgi:O-antigen ligase